MWPVKTRWPGRNPETWYSNAWPIRKNTIPATQHAFFSTKIRNAIEHGASAVILVNDPDSVSESIQNVKSKIARENQRRESIEQQLAALKKDALRIPEQERASFAARIRHRLVQLSAN